MTQNTIWKTNKISRLAHAGDLQLYTDEVLTPSGNEEEMHYLEARDSVMIVPLKVKSEEEVSFILIEQYRYPIGRSHFEFPAGDKDPTESNEEAAKRVLGNVSGYKEMQTKFFYSYNPIPSISSLKTSIYVAYVEDDPEGSEKSNTEINVKEFSADEVLRMIRDNELTDGKTLAALTTVLLQSPKALEYANSFSQDERIDEKL